MTGEETTEVIRALATANRELRHDLHTQGERVRRLEESLAARDAICRQYHAKMIRLGLARRERSMSLSDFNDLCQRVFR